MAYGFRFRDAAGNVTLTIDEAMPRLVHSQRFTLNYSGSITVPDFDSDHGMYYISPAAERFVGGSYTPNNSAPLTQYPGLNHRGFALNSAAGSPAQLSWNNATKVMTIRPVSYPSGWPEDRKSKTGYYLNFIALNKRFII